MIETSKLLNAINNKVRIWGIEKTFETPNEAKHYAAKLFAFVSGVRVTYHVGGCYTVFAWIKDAK